MLPILGGLAGAAAAQDLSPLPAASPASDTRHVRIPRVTEAPRILDYQDGGQAPGARITGFRQRTPSDGTPVSEETVAYLSYDSTNLYVVFVCREEPHQLRAHMSRRENVNDDDHVGVILDTFRDRQRAYSFVTNPLGVQADGILSGNAVQPDRSFDTVWHSEGRTNPDGFIVLMAIPFKSLRFSSDVQQVWNIALTRRIGGTNETAYWPHITLREQGVLAQLAVADGLEAISPGQNVQFVPSTTGGVADVRDRTGRFVTSRDWQASLDSKFVIRNAFTFDLTVNPDFSQVESDDPQVLLNQRFEVSFPEKRPFFLENAQYFKTPIDLFFSRRVANPEHGGRMTGKAGRWALGVLAIDDRAPGLRVQEGHPDSGRRARIGVVRVAREFATQSSVGVMGTGYGLGDAFNGVFAADLQLRLSPTWRATGQVAWSDDRSRDGNREDGRSIVADVSGGGEHFAYAGRYLEVSPTFKTPLGFVRRSDLRHLTQYVTYLWRPESSPVYNLGPALSGYVNLDHGGRLQDWFADARFATDFAGPAGIEVGYARGIERYLGIQFDRWLASGSFYGNWLRWLNAYGEYAIGQGINYSPIDEALPAPARTRDAGFGFLLQPVPRLRIDQSLSYSHLSTPDGDVIFDNYISRTKVNYQFTRAFSIRAIVDYYAQKPNVRFIDDIDFKRLTGDVLLTYLTSPWTAVHIGYNGRFENLISGPEGPTWAADKFASTPTSRQIFVKLSYLLRP